MNRGILIAALFLLLTAGGCVTGGYYSGHYHSEYGPWNYRNSRDWDWYGHDLTIYGHDGWRERPFYKDDYRLFRRHATPYHGFGRFHNRHWRR